VVARVLQGHVRLLLSDVSAALDWDLAVQVLDHLGLEVPEEDDAEVEPAGDLDVVDDLGVDAFELEELLSDLDAYADEVLRALAERLGFAAAYERLVGS
jgi:putative tRNA adenosine deaminase-associated protein